MHGKYKWFLVGLVASLAGTITPELWSQAASSNAPTTAFTSTSISLLEKPSTRKGREVTIRSWYLLGPYAEIPGQPTDILNHDYMMAGSHSEEQINSSLLATLNKDRSRCQVYATEKSIINLSDLFPTSPHSILYAAAILDSDTEGYVGLQYDVSFGSKLWLNGTLIDQYTSSSRHPVAMYVHFVPLSIKRGPNILLIKMDQGDLGPKFEPWALAASLLPIERLWELALSNQDGFLLSNRLLDKGGQIHIPILDNPMMLDRSKPIALSVLNEAGEPLVSKTISRGDHGNIDLSALDKGYYTVKLGVAGHVVDDALYIGDPSRVLAEMQSVQASTPANSDEFLQRDAIIKRYEILTSAQYRKESDPDWQRKFLAEIGEAEASIAKRSQRSWYLRPGQHLREFVSTTDGLPHNYFFDVPSVDARRPMGLIVVVPYAVSRPRPFLESTFISYSAVLEQTRQAAENTHTSVAIIGAKESMGESPLDEAEAFEVVKDITTHYSIDPKRIYLYGVSEGGRRALLLAERYPGIFAGVGVWAPLLGVDSGTSDEVLASVKTLAKTPIVLFKGDMDRELSNETFERLGKALESAGNHAVTIRIVRNAMHDPMRMESVIFPLLTRYQNVAAPPHIGTVAAKVVERLHY